MTANGYFKVKEDGSIEAVNGKFTGEINALKRFKDDVKEVGTNFECGISLTGCNDIKVGDVIETFTEIEVEQKL